MTREQVTRKRAQLAARLSGLGDVLRGSPAPPYLASFQRLLQVRRRPGAPPLVLNVNYPGGKTRQLSLRPEQLPQVRKALRHYRQVKEALETHLRHHMACPKIKYRSQA